MLLTYCYNSKWLEETRQDMTPSKLQELQHSLAESKALLELSPQVPQDLRLELLRVESAIGYWRLFFEMSSLKATVRNGKDLVLPLAHVRAQTQLYGGKWIDRELSHLRSRILDPRTIPNDDQERLDSQ